MRPLNCTHCRTSVPVVAINVSDTIQRTRIGPCCIVDNDADLAGLDLSSSIFVGIVGDGIARMGQQDARAAMAAYRAANPAPVAAPDPVPAPPVPEPDPAPAPPTDYDPATPPVLPAS